MCVFPPKGLILTIFYNISDVHHILIPRRICIHPTHPVVSVPPNPPRCVCTTQPTTRKEIQIHRQECLSNRPVSFHRELSHPAENGITNPHYDETVRTPTDEFVTSSYLPYIHDS